jgi:hypothetical protein
MNPHHFLSFWILIGTQIPVFFYCSTCTWALNSTNWKYKLYNIYNYIKMTLVNRGDPRKKTETWCGIQETPSLAHLLLMSSVCLVDISSGSGCQNLQSGRVHPVPYLKCFCFYKFVPGPMLWSQFSAILENYRRKTNVMIRFLNNLALFWVKNAIFFADFFRQKYLRNHNIGPRSFIIF